MNPVVELLLAHRSIRRFASAPVPDVDVRQAVAAAQMAASSSNVQAYSLLRVRDPERRRELARLCGDQPQVEQAGAFFVVSGDQRRHRAAAALHGRPFEPNLESFLVCVVDAALFAQNLVVAFESMGYGICYVGGLRNRLHEVDELLRVPADVFPFYGLCVGVPAERPARRPRLAVESVLHEERYPDDEEVRRGIGRYDEVMRTYYAAGGRPGRDWSGGIARKFEEARRTELLAYYRSKGARFA